MSELRVTTWNVLHRVHAVNWDEASVGAFPDERVRIARISESVRQWLASGVSVVCLQEVSGDQLASLRACVGPRVTVLHHVYPRVPRVRRGGGPVLTDTTEHLVALALDPRASLITAQTFASDPGKGLLAVSAEGAVVIATHVSFGPRSREQLATVAAVARGRSEAAIVAGDFNAEVEDVRSGLGAGFVLSSLASEPPTRRATGSSDACTIDHVAVLRGAIASARVLDGEGLSDHSPVSATVLVD